MEDRKFDALVARLASGLTRRGAIATLAAAGAGQWLGNTEARRKKKKVKICRNGQTLSVTKKKKAKTPQARRFGWPMPGAENHAAPNHHTQAATLSTQRPKLLRPA